MLRLLSDNTGDNTPYTKALTTKYTICQNNSATELRITILLHKMCMII